MRAYDIRICFWSSDVCSDDLREPHGFAKGSMRRPCGERGSVPRPLPLRLTPLPRRRNFSPQVGPTPTQHREDRAMAKSPYDTDLDRNAANYVPLSPLSFIARSAAVFPDRPAVVHGDRTPGTGCGRDRGCKYG